MRTISQRFKDALDRSHDLVTQIDITVPGGSAVRLRWMSASVSSSKSSGVRYQASVTFAPTPGVDTYALISTPGALFTVRHGINFGAGDMELIDCGVFEAASGSVRIGSGDVSVTLVDLWQRLDRVKFSAPFAPTGGTRAALIAAVVNVAVPAASIYSTTDGGTFVEGNNVWDEDRPSFVNDMCRDGSLDAAFDASGAFRIRTEPILDRSASVWTFRTGEVGNIESAERERPFDKIYNRVVVQPLDSTQSWDQQIVDLADTSHPNHSSKIGTATLLYKSATANTSAEAAQVGITMLQRVLGDTGTISITGIANPALEVGDVVTIVHAPTVNDPGFTAFHIIDSFSLNLADGSMQLATRSSTLSTTGVS